MRLLSAEIHNFRCHRGEAPVSIQFDQNVHVIHGPNESGKSTLAEAVAAALFCKATITGETLKRMQPYDGAKPVVMVEFEQGGRYKVEKHFKGQNGTCTLRQWDGDRMTASWQGSDAEQRLQGLLGVPEQGKGERRPEQMAHWRLLWVHQGTSMKSPSDNVNPETRGALEGILARETDAAITTPEEARLIAELHRAVEDRFTPVGRQHKAGGAVNLAEKEHERLSAELSDAEGRVRAIEQLSENHEKLQREIAGIQKQLPQLEARLKDRKAQKEKADQLTRDLAAHEKDLELAKREFREAHDDLKSVSDLKGSLEGLQEESQKADLELQELRQELDQTEEDRPALDAERTQAEQALQEARRSLMRMQAHTRALQAQVEVGRFQEDFTRAQAAEEEKAELERQDAQLLVTAEDLEALRLLEQSVAEARAALEAASARLQFRSSVPMKLEKGGECRDLEAGVEQDLVVDEHVLLEIGEGIAQVQVTPGREGLEQRRQRLAQAEAALADKLEHAGAKSVPEASRVVAEKADVQSRLGLAEARLAVLAPDGTDCLRGRLAEQRKALAESIARRDGHIQEGDPDLPGTLTATEQETGQLQAAQAQAEKAHGEAKNRIDQMDATIADSRRKIELAAQGLRHLADRQDDKTRTLAQILRKYSDEAGLAAQDQERGERVQGLREQCDQTRTQLSELSPESIEAEVDRAAKSVAASNDELQQKIKEQEGVRGQLQAADAFGLHERVGQLQADVGAARERLGRERLQAKALLLLHDTVRECQQEATRDMMEPLRERVEPLLRLVFRDAQINFALDDTSGQFVLEPLVREDEREEFGDLSMGTREQVGVAVRLAIGQVLAEDHDKCLPIVLDEPFVNTDPDRLRLMLGMLNQVKHSLQVVVLTCDFSGYRELGLHAAQVTELPLRHGTRQQSKT